MWQNWTERARQVVFFAQEETLDTGFTQVLPEHLLLGLIRQDASVALRLLEQREITRDQIRTRIQPPPGGEQSQEFGISPELKAAIDVIYEEARLLGNN